MIRVEKITEIKRDAAGNIAECKIEAFADTKNEVTENATYIGLPEGSGIMMGSSIMTASFEVAMRKSDGTWQW